MHADDYARDVNEEMRFHMALDAEHQAHDGGDAGDARRAARRRFGNATYLSEEVRYASGRAPVDVALQDRRDAWRLLRRAPAFAFVAIVTLALGIGSTTAAFSIVDGVVLRGLPYHDADRIVEAYEVRDDGGFRTPSYPTYVDWQAQAASVSDAIEGVAFIRGDGVALPGDDGPERQIDAFVTPGFFSLLGTRPALGRTFLPDEETPGGARVALISWELFLKRFGGDSTAIGKTLNIDSVPTTVVGVMPRAFAYANFAGARGWYAPAIWQPIAPYRATHNQLSLRGLHVDSRTLLRLKPGVDSARAAAAMRLIAGRLAAEYPAEQAHWTSVAFQPIGAALYGDLRRALLLIAGAIALVLLLACANVANLLLVRASVRAREIAVRAALGASRWRLARQLLAESLVLSLSAGAVGVVLASALVAYVRRAASERLPFAVELHVDSRTALFAIGASLATALVVGLVPALQATAGDLMARMRSGGTAAAGGRRERRLRNLLVSVQFGLAVTLLIGAGLLLQSFRRMASVPLGYDPNGIVAFATAPPKVKYGEPAQAAAVYARILDGLRALPGVTSAAAAGGAVLPTTVETVAPPTAGPPNETGYHPVSTEYLKTMRVPVVAAGSPTPTCGRPPGSSSTRSWRRCSGKARARSASGSR